MDNLKVYTLARYDFYILLLPHAQCIQHWAILGWLKGHVDGGSVFVIKHTTQIRRSKLRMKCLRTVSPQISHM